MSDMKNPLPEERDDTDGESQDETEPQPRPIPPRNPPQNFASGSRFGSGKNFRSQTDGNARRIHRNAQRGR